MNLRLEHCYRSGLTNVNNTTCDPGLRALYTSSVFIQWLGVLANPRLIGYSGSYSDWRPNDENWRLLGVAEE